MHTRALLTRLGYKVLVRTMKRKVEAFISKGFLEEAKLIYIKNVATFAPLIDVVR
jgi:hypothetical protein